MSDDILDWLKHWPTYPSVKETYGSNIIRAANEIERLRAENEKLRAALNRIDGMATTICMKNDAGYPIQLGNVMQIYQEARAAAALKETGDE